MLKNLLRKLFGIKCPRCNGLGVISVFNNTSGCCPVCDGKRRIETENSKLYLSLFFVLLSLVAIIINYEIISAILCGIGFLFLISFLQE